MLYWDFVFGYFRVWDRVRFRFVVVIVGGEMLEFLVVGRWVV